MSYQINKTDGTLLTNLIDGQIDKNSTNLVLVGRNYTGYGELFNENFVKLLENFSNSAAPSNPLEGQTWWDRSDRRLKVFDGTVWKASGGPFVQDTRPQMVAGDLWIDNLNNQVYAFDGTDTILIGPQYTSAERESGFKIGTLLDQQSRSRTVAYLYVGGSMVGIFSSLEFIPVFSQRIAALVTSDNPAGTIFEGFNVINKSSFKFRGIAESANALVTQGGVVRTADSFLPANANGITTGTLTIQNSGGLTIGTSQNNVQKIVGPRFYIENQLNDHDISLRVSSSKFGATTVDGIYIDASAGRVGIFNQNRLPAYTLDVEGDLRVTGSLIVQGETTNLNITTLTVEDKNIELAKTSTGALLSAIDADEAGLTLDTSDGGTKTWQWREATNAWTSSVNVNVSNTNRAYRIGGLDKLTNSSLVNIQTAPDLVEIGTLNYLNVDSIGIAGSTITANPGNVLTLASSNGISVSSQIISNLSNPTSDQDAATKVYTDTEIAATPVFFSLDVTALGTGGTLQDAVAGYLADMYAPTTLTDGKVVKILTVSYAGASVSGVQFVDADITRNFVEVDKALGGTVDVIQDFLLPTASGQVQLTPSRALMIYESDGTEWIFQTATDYL